MGILGVIIIFLIWMGLLVFILKKVESTINEKQPYDIKDLEERCRKANFAPYDDRLPVHDYEFEWDEHTIKIAEDWLKQHHSNNELNKD